MSIITDKEKIQTLLDRGILDTVLPSRDFLISELSSGKRLRIYIGFDPTGTALHLGHAQNLMFLEDLRKLGHEVIILFGDFTARIGDPDKSSARTQLTKEQVLEYAKGWVDQVRPLLDFDDTNNPPVIRYNSEWLEKLSFADVISLASHFTVQQMIERDMFQKRIQSGSPVYLHEFMYPLMQGYDSVVMDVDVELCATDQLFNALAGRTLQKKMHEKEKHVIALRLVANPVTGELMSKSRGSGVLLDLSANEMYGALMSQPDEMTEIFFTSCTRIPLEKKDEIMQMGPRDAKMFIAREIVGIFHGAENATKAEESFIETFRKGGVPDDMPIVTIDAQTSLVDILVAEKLVPSKSEWKRLVEGGAVSIHEGEKITDVSFVPNTSCVIKIGKRLFVNVVRP
jgi:tyrosyl-tRNA synthetase